MSKKSLWHAIIAWAISVLFSLLVPTVVLFTAEWVHRGTLLHDFWNKYFVPHFCAYAIAWLLLWLLYLCISGLTGHHWPAVLAVALPAELLAVITRFMLDMRGEPFLPWTITQAKDFFTVAGNVKLTVPVSMWCMLAICVALLVVSVWVRVPLRKKTRARCIYRLTTGSVSFAAILVMLFGLFFQSDTMQNVVGVYPDMWMQDRYYRYYGLVTGFLTNVPLLHIAEPEDYSQNTVDALVQRTQENEKSAEPLYAESYAATAGVNAAQQPDIIYVMDESFWDAERLPGIQYDIQLAPNLAALKQESAYGYCYSPSYGGGTCDVEFEALTGYSTSYLPTGSKPFQQYVTRDMFSLPQYLRAQGYDTVAVHGYFRRFWSRDTAYPHLGINTFIAKEDILHPQTRRGYISDAEMAKQIIAAYEARTEAGAVFLHAVTMQNHTTYDAKNYNANELVNILQAPEGIDGKTLGQLRDFATGVHEADAMLGALTAYFRTVDRPVILVFWGDHFNPIGTEMELYEATGFIDAGEDSSSPKLHQTDLLIWSNYASASIDLGTLAAYEISPVMMDLYGLEKPDYFAFLTQEFSVMRARTRGITAEPDGTFSEELTPEQTTWYNDQWQLQYDMMFGKGYLPSYAPEN